MKKINNTIIGIGFAFAGGAGILKAIMVFICMFSIGIRLVAPPEMKILLGDAPHVIGIDNSIFVEEFLETDFSSEEIEILEETKDMMETLADDIDWMEDWLWIQQRWL